MAIANAFRHLGRQSIEEVVNKTFSFAFVVHLYCNVIWITFVPYGVVLVSPEGLCLLMCLLKYATQFLHSAVSI